MTIKIRAAQVGDANHMAQLVDMAGGGLPGTLWSDIAAPNQSALDVGIARAKRSDGAFSYRKARIAELNGEVAGMIISYDVGPQPEEMSSETHPMFRPLIKLENNALKTRYINVLATFPQFRRKGVASSMIAEAEAMPGPEGMSIITTDTNTEARAFYEALGYRDAVQAPVIKANWKTRAHMWHLLRKP